MAKIEKELIELVLYVLYRRADIHKPINFEDMPKKIDRKKLLKILKYLHNRGLVLRKPSKKSSKGRWKLNPKAKHIWEPIVWKTLKKKSEL